jgi:hypothetical protein
VSHEFVFPSRSFSVFSARFQIQEESRTFVDQLTREQLRNWKDFLATDDNNEWHSGQLAGPKVSILSLYNELGFQ